ncbi:MAG: segregation/condensation protein A [Chloroflexi bacterium]|nr:segregation/condensation protein A [Chloroflexota bacterium]
MQVNLSTSNALSEAFPYRVKLEVFEGPLDLLLHLIERQELDITKISLAAVTDQYLEYICTPGRVSVDNLAEFLVVAAKLLLIKSRALLPAPPVVAEGEQEDVGDELARQLREYKAFKELALHLREREELGLRAYLRLSAPPRLERKLDLREVSLEELIAAARQAFALEPPPEPADAVVTPLTVTIADRIQYIDSLLVGKGILYFHDLLREAGSRPVMIITFLALLELLKAGRVQVQQERLFGEIVVLRAEPAQPSAAAQ